MECGTTCLAMIFKYYGYYNIKTILTELAEVNTEGTDLYTISEIAERFGFKTDGYELKYEYLLQITLPCIAHYEGNHFIVIYKANEKYVWTADPAYGKDKLTKEAFMRKWNGVVLTLEPTPEAFKNKDLIELVETYHNKKKSVFKKFYWTTLAPFKKILGEILLASLILQILGLALPFFTQAIIDSVLVNQNKKLLFGILLGMLLIFVTQVIILYVRNILLVQFKVQFELDFFSKFFDHFTSLKQRFYDSHKREDFITRFNEKVKIRSLANPYLLQSVIDLFFIIGYLPILFIYNVQLGLLAAFFTLSYLAVSVYFTPRIRDLINKIFYKDAAVLGKFLDTLLGMQTVKLLGMEKLRFWRWKNEYKRNLNIVLESEQTEILLVSIQRSLFFFSQLVIFWYGAYLAFTGQLTIGQYLAFITIFMIIINALNSVSNLWLNMMELSVSADRINDILTQEPEYTDVLKQKAISQIEEIELDNLSFKYNERDSQSVLKNISLKITSGQHIGIVGRNGAGKTTLVKLLVNLYPHYEGSIKVNQTEIREINPRVLRKRIFLFPQDIFIFDGSIKENILFANPKASIEEVIEAAKLADLHDFVKRLYLGYNHKIGEYGANLSGGQKLMIGFARLFISDPDVIILDEASSSLDLQTEKRIMANVKKKFKSKTIISIAHRVHTLRDSDRILVIDEGKLVEDGNHEELLKRKALYYQFVQSYIEI